MSDDELDDVSGLTSREAHIVRLYLERIAMKLDRFQTNPAYKAAFKKAAQLIRENKPD